MARIFTNAMRREAWFHTKNTEYTEPFGAYLSHADGADFRRQGLFINVITRLVLQDRGSVFLCNQLTKISRFAELILCISVSSVCYDS